MSKLTWPAWFNDADGNSAIFKAPEEVPRGWTSGAEKLSAGSGSAAPIVEKADDAGTLDAEGWPWTEELHAATRSLTTAGLWRMRVGVSRPDPKPGFPKPLLDL